MHSAGEASLMSFPKLNRENFKVWKYNINLYLASQDLSEYCSEPVVNEPGAHSSAKDDPATVPVLDEKTKRKEKKALAIICLSVEENLKSLLYEASTPSDAWVILRAAFEPSSRARIAALRRKFFNIQYERATGMSDYIGRVLEAAKDLRLAGKDIADDEVAFQLLENLPHPYENLVVQLYRLPDEEFTTLEIRKQLLAEADRQKCRVTENPNHHHQALLSIKKRNEWSRREVRCFHCGKLGHLKKNCFQLNKPSQANQHKKFVVKQNPAPGAQRKLETDKQCHFAAFLSESRSLEVVLDSAATHHFITREDAFQTLERMESCATIAEGSTRILGVGEVTLHFDSGTVKNLTLKNAYYAPDMYKNLVSVRCLCEEGLTVNFTKDKAEICNGDGEILSAPLKDRFYSMLTSYEKNRGLEGAFIANKNLMLWHSRFGHFNCRTLSDLSKSSNVIGLNKLGCQVEECEFCNLAKSKKGSFPEIENIRTTEVLQLVHLDIWGPAPVLSLGNARYFLTVTDDFSRYSHVYTLQTKDQAFEYFQQYKSLVEKQKGKRIKAIRTDCGGEFCSGEFEKFLKAQGIKHEKTNPYSPQMNGVAERLNRSLMEGVRSILFQTELPSALWAELVLTVNYLKNRFPHKKLNGKTPLNVWANRIFSVRHLKMIGSKAFVHVSKRRSKFDERAKKGILIGYASSTKGYRIWYPGTNLVEETKHVKINENDFKFETNEVSNNFNFNLFNDFKGDENLNDSGSSQSSCDEFTPPPPPVSDWKRVEVPRRTGKTKGRVDIYYYPEKGLRLRSKKKVKEYCEEKGIPYNPNDFNWTPEKQISFENGNDKEGESDNESKSNGEAFCIDIKIPKTYEESQCVPEKLKWQEAMKKELEILKEREVFELVPRPEHTRVLGSKWVFTVKEGESQKVKVFKARLVAQGFRQIGGINYFDTFSPVISFSLVRLCYVIFSINKKWINLHLDIKCAYLYATLNELIYIEQPTGFLAKDKGSWVMKLNKALYGLHQAGREWYLELDNTFKELGLTKIESCNCLYMYKFKVILLVYVDDLAIFAENNTVLDEIVSLIKSKFEVKVLGKIQNFLGVEFQEVKGQVFMHQQKYITKLQEVFKDIPRVKCRLPLSPGEMLCKTSESISNEVPYRELIGCLLYLASRTRPDIQYSVIALSQFSNEPSWTHWKNLCQVFQYVINTKNFSINLSRNSNNHLKVYADASWASDLISRKSISGYVILIDEVPVIWSSSKQKCTALSSMEAEYIALSDSIKELSWLIRILDDFSALNLKLEKPFVFCDNQSTVFFSRNNIENSRTKYIDTRSYFVKENLCKFELKHVSGKANVADIFTKALPFESFSFYCKWLFG